MNLEETLSEIENKPKINWKQDNENVYVEINEKGINSPKIGIRENKILEFAYI